MFLCHHRIILALPGNGKIVCLYLKKEYNQHTGGQDSDTVTGKGQHLCRWCCSVQDSRPVVGSLGSQGNSLGTL